jgi:hypothetical protein
MSVMAMGMQLNGRAMVCRVGAMIRGQYRVIATAALLAA